MSEQEQPRRARPPMAFYVLSSAIEWYVLAEILWYYLHNGESTLHGPVVERVRAFRDRARERASIQRALNMIRDLPET